MDQAANLTDLVFRNADEAPDFASFARNGANGWEDVTSVQFRDAVVALAKGLVAAGVEPGERGIVAVDIADDVDPHGRRA
jgi:long-chain acyl-CoA synthetase